MAAVEEATELAEFLPISFQTPKGQEYIEFLWDVSEINDKHRCEVSLFHVSRNNENIK